MMKRNVTEAMWIVLFAACVALSSNFVRPHGLPLLRTRSAPSPSMPQNEAKKGVVTFKDFVQASKKSDVLILDARSEEDYGEGHVPGAKNLPFETFSEKSARVLSSVPFDRKIITYCEGAGCALAEDLAALIREMGYRDIKVFAGGWEEWMSNAMPVAEGRSVGQ